MIYLNGFGKLKNGKSKLFLILGLIIPLSASFIGCSQKGFKQTHARCKESKQIARKKKATERALAIEQKRQNFQPETIQKLHAQVRHLTTEQRIAETECQEAYFRHSL